MELYRPKLIEEKSNDELKEGIIQELRVLMGDFSSLIQSENRIRKIQISKFLLDDRNDAVYEEVDKLEKETDWKFSLLFEDCISYPDKAMFKLKYSSLSPNEKAERICQVCDEYKDEIANYKLTICDTCLIDCDTSLSQKQSLEDCILFTTPESKYWCNHADKNTLLMSMDKYYVFDSVIICERCITEEKDKRSQKSK